MDKVLVDKAEAANWALAHSWHDGLGLEYAGVNIGDCLQYSLLSVVGRIWLAHKPPAANTPEPANG